MQRTPPLAPGRGMKQYPGKGTLKENWKVSGAIVGVSAAAWVSSFLLHNHYLSFLNHAPGIDLIFAPSGVRMLALLIGGIWAAIGICLGSLYLNLTGSAFNTAQLGTILAIALCSGFCPYVAMRASLRMVGAGANLARLTPARLPLVSLGVAAGSSLLHNLLFAGLGLAAWPSFWSNSLAMAAGDFIGILLAMIVVFAGLRLLRTPAK